MTTTGETNNRAGLAGRCLLVVEDNYLVADTLCRDLHSAGVVVVGPCATVDDALALLQQEGARIQGAILDVNLRGQRSYPVADDLSARGIPFVFVTGYGSPLIDSAYAWAPRCEKPLDPAKLAGLLAASSAIIPANDPAGHNRP